MSGMSDKWLEKRLDLSLAVSSLSFSFFSFSPLLSSPLFSQDMPLSMPSLYLYSGSANYLHAHTSHSHPRLSIPCLITRFLPIPTNPYPSYAYPISIYAIFYTTCPYVSLGICRTHTVGQRQLIGGWKGTGQRDTSPRGGEGYLSDEKRVVVVGMEMESGGEGGGRGRGCRLAFSASTITATLGQWHLSRGCLNRVAMHGACASSGRLRDKVFRYDGHVDGERMALWSSW